MQMKPKKNDVLLLGLLVAAGLLVAMITAGLWSMHNSGMNIWFTIAAVVICGALLLLAVLIVLPESNEGMPVLHDRSEKTPERQEAPVPPMDAGEAERLARLLGAIQTINRGLDQAVVEIRDRMKTMAEPADDRNPEERNNEMSTQSQEQKITRIH